MRPNRILWSLFAVLVLTPSGAVAGTSIGWSVTIGNAPPPPTIVFQREPRLIVVPGSTVYVLKDRREYDVFRYGVFWYVFHDDYWYRARTYRGPFVAVNPRYVPSAISNVPAKYWRHHPHGGPPGLKKKRYGDQVVSRENRRRKD